MRRDATGHIERGDDCSNRSRGDDRQRRNIAFTRSPRPLRSNHIAKDSLLARLLQPMHADRAIHALRGDFDDSRWSLARCRTGLTSQNAGCYVLRDLENDIGQMRA